MILQICLNLILNGKLFLMAKCFNQVKFLMPDLKPKQVLHCKDSYYKN